MIPMDTAPQDGTRILLKYWPKVYEPIHPRDYGWKRTPEPKWEECRWVDDQDKTGSRPHWEPWTGKESIRTTEHISPVDAIGWLPLPEEVKMPTIELSPEDFERVRELMNQSPKAIIKVRPLGEEP